MGLGCGLVGEEQIRSEIADHAIVAAVVLNQRNRGAAEAKMTTDDGEVLGLGIRVSGAKHHKLVAFQRIEIDDQVQFGSGRIEHEAISTASPDEDVGTLTTIEKVIALPAVEHVIALLAVEMIVAAITVEDVPAGAASEAVVTAAAVQLVSAGSTLDAVGSTFAIELVVAGPAIDVIRTPARVNAVGAFATG